MFTRATQCIVLDVLDPPVSVFSLSLYRHPFLYTLFNSHFTLIINNNNPLYLRVYDNRDSSRQTSPSPSLYYSLTHAPNTLPTPTHLTITWTQVLWFLERLTRPTVSYYVTTRTRFTVCLPTQPSVCEVF